MGSERSRTRSRPVQECPGSPDRQGSSRAASRLVAGSMPGSISTTMWSGPLRAHQEFLAQGVTKASLRSSAAPFPGRCGAKPKCNASPPPVCTSASTGRLGRAIPLAIRSNTGKRIRPSVRCAALSSHAWHLTRAVPGPSEPVGREVEPDRLGDHRRMVVDLQRQGPPVAEVPWTPDPTSIPSSIPWCQAMPKSQEMHRR